MASEKTWDCDWACKMPTKNNLLGKPWGVYLTRKAESLIQYKMCRLSHNDVIEHFKLGVELDTG